MIILPESMRGEAFYIFEPMAGFEPATSSLPRKCSTPELHRQCSFCSLSGRRGSNPRPSAWKADALSTELLPQNMWVEMDSNHRSDDAADLQSAPFGHSGIYPLCYVLWASCRIRTNDPEITNHVLWPTELKRHLSLCLEIRGDLVCGCKGTTIF